ncbi:MAG: hypothetical protein KC553_14715, partial [Nitrospina sp.]|nr:hypothetical protein [Nitrospina sp.]
KRPGLIEPLRCHPEPATHPTYSFSFHKNKGGILRFAQNDTLVVITIVQRMVPPLCHSEELTEGERRGISPLLFF